MIYFYRTVDPELLRMSVVEVDKGILVDTYDDRKSYPNTNYVNRKVSIYCAKARIPQVWVGARDVFKKSDLDFIKKALGENIQGFYYSKFIQFKPNSSMQYKSGDVLEGGATRFFKNEKPISNPDLVEFIAQGGSVEDSCVEISAEDIPYSTVRTDFLLESDYFYAYNKDGYIYYSILKPLAKVLFSDKAEGFKEFLGDLKEVDQEAFNVYLRERG